MTDTLRYTHKAVTCLESGIYTCTARNQYNFGNDAIATLELHIKCSPRPLHQMKTNFTSVLYDTATLNFTALAYPEPGMNGFVWHKQNSFTWIPLLSNADVVILSSGLHTRLTIKNVSRSDFGHYRVTVTNEIGKYEQYIFLTETDAQTSTQPSQRAYANLSFQTVNTDEDYSRPSTNDTAAVTNDNEYSVQNYTDLHHLSNDNQRTYDVIQKT
ncbi:uncharacterized protein LOC132753501 isoform X3 [Ruditapes philippinarum]|uniref:uncharacterized protein LOC132753501 isoform X3 n=1 Tax=Ruditapes philippinarum TaxID=129788 RepID=UPI00295B761F|nr:uncharacterized protein LOC132753501 isoform X3 [Ruditapes philippinarum]